MSDGSAPGFGDYPQHVVDDLREAREVLDLVERAGHPNGKTTIDVAIELCRRFYNLGRRES